MIASRKGDLRLLLQRGELDKAENLLHISLRMAQDLHNRDGVIYIYDLLANIAFQRGDYMKAERLFKVRPKMNKEIMPLTLSSTLAETGSRISLGSPIFQHL